MMSIEFRYANEVLRTYANELAASQYRRSFLHHFEHELTKDFYRIDLCVRFRSKNIRF